MDETERLKGLNRTQLRESYIKSQGYRVEVMWECQFQVLRN